MKPEEARGDYGSRVAEAEKAVADVKDPKLREIAFSQVLSHLLSSSSDVEEPVRQKRGAASKVRKSPNSSARTAKAKVDGPKGWLRELADEDFFAKPQSLRQILEELGNRSHHLPATGLTSPLQSLCHEKVLRRKRMPPADGKAPVYHWSNW